MMLLQQLQSSGQSLYRRNLAALQKFLPPFMEGAFTR